MILDLSIRLRQLLRRSKGLACVHNDVFALCLETPTFNIARKHCVSLSARTTMSEMGMGMEMGMAPFLAPKSLGNLSSPHTRLGLQRIQ